MLSNCVLRHLVIATALCVVPPNSLADLKEAVVTTATAPAAVPTILDRVPPGHVGNRSVVGLETILHYLSSETRSTLTYERLMGLSGMAFILQAQDDHSYEGMIDVGWWPLDSWGFYGRVDFLSQAIGWRLRSVDEAEAEFRADPAAYYRKHFAPEVKASIAAGKPLLGRHDQCFLITGYDDLNKPPLGRVACDEKTAVYRPEGDPAYPWGLLVFDAKTDTMAMAAADREAMRYAVALASDLTATPSPHHTTGRKSWQAWAKFLREGGKTQDRHHANMLVHLRLQRTAAAGFLKEMAQRQAAPAAGHLSAAADLYQQLLEESKKARTGGVDKEAAARRALLAVVEQLARLDASAAAEMEKALAAWQHDAPR